MQKLLCRALFLCLLCGPFTALAKTTVTVHKADDTTCTGEVAAVADGAVTLETKSAKGPPKRTKILFSDMAQVVFRDPPAKVAPQASQMPDANAGSASGEPVGIMGAIRSIFGSSSSSTSSVEEEQPKKTRKPAKATTRAGATTHAAAADLGAWSISLINGDTLQARFETWADHKIKVKLGAPLGQSVEIPGDQVAAIWSGNTDAVKKARALKVEPGPDDVVYAQKDDDVVSVTGQALGIAGDALNFRYGDAERKIAMDRLVGIVFGQGGQSKPADALSQSFKLDTGDILSGSWTGMDKDAALLRTAWGEVVRIPAADIYTVDMVNGRVVYVSDLKPSKVEQTPYFGRVIPFRVDASLDGGPLKLSDAAYAKGIAVHSRCVLVYNLSGNFERFRAKLGFEQPAGALGRVAVRVLSGGKVLYENPDARGDQPPVDLDLDMTGQHQLTLEVDFGKDQDVGDRVIWANARLLRAKPPE